MEPKILLQSDDYCWFYGSSRKKSKAFSQFIGKTKNSRNYVVFLVKITINRQILSDFNKNLPFWVNTYGRKGRGP